MTLSDPESSLLVNDIGDAAVTCSIDLSPPSTNLEENAHYDIASLERSRSPPSPPPPSKRVRFFQSEDDESKEEAIVLESVPDVLDSVSSSQIPVPAAPSQDTARSHFKGQLEAVVGPVSTDIFSILWDRYPEKVAEAIDLYFDLVQELPARLVMASTQAKTSQGPQTQSTLIKRPEPATKFSREEQHLTEPSVSTQEPAHTPAPPPPPPHWDRRFIGSLQADVYATRSGRNLIKYNESMPLLRDPQPIGAARRSLDTVKVSNKDDSIIRLGNSKRLDIARMPEELARYMSVLIDTKVCEFEGTCIFADDNLRIGDYIIVQIECYLLRSAFRSMDIVPESMRSLTGVREFDPHAGGHYDGVGKTPTFFNQATETADEKIMRLRQQGLVHLFAKLDLQSELPDSLKSLGGGKSLLERMAQASEIPNETQPAGKIANDDGEQNEEALEFSPEQMDTIYRRTSQMQDSHLTEVETPNTFKMELRPYQKRGLNWLLQREALESSVASTPNPDYTEPMHPLWQQFKWPPQPDSVSVEADPSFYANLYNGELSLSFPRQKKSVLGGILADEMGLGKTISTMALVHSNTYDPATAKEPERADYAKYTTLIVAPMSLLSQWESEGYAASKQGHIRILVYYGMTASSVNLRDLLCGPDARTKAPHIVITSYGTLVSEHNMLVQFRQRHKVNEEDWRESLDLRMFNLYSVEFFRVVLDEGHTIKNRATKAAKACCNVRSDRRWVLTGTPIINKLEDLFSLVKFLGVEPWNNFSFWKTFITVPFMTKDFASAVNVVQSVMEPLLLRRTKDMKQLDGTPLVSLPDKTISIERIQLSPDERQLYDCIFYKAQVAFNDSLNKGTAMKSYSTIMTQILRLRQACNHPAMVTKALFAMQKLADVPGETSPSKKSRADGSLVIDNILDQSLQDLVARLNANASTVGETSDAKSFGHEVIDTILKGADSECPICMTERIPLDDQAVTQCWHMACLDCLVSHMQFQLQKGENPRCHMCREQVSLDKIYLVKRQRNPRAGPNEQPRIKLKRYNPAGQSAKVRALLTHLKATRTNSPGTKSVVFSQFTEFLDIIQAELVSEGFECLRFDGTMSQAERARVLEAFKDNPTTSTLPPVTNIGYSPTIMLISLKAGGVGLNLVSASQVFMMDPWWSYAVEAQAIDRIHRMGQTQAVKVVRLIVEGSVEERILKIQERKKFLASTLGMTEEEKKAQRLEDIKAIFES